MGLSGFPKLTEANGKSSLPPYLRIDPDGGIHLGVPSSEMGQGTHTTLAMLVAEELEVEMEQIQHIETLHHPDFKNGYLKTLAPKFNFQTTGGSSSIQAWHQPFRKLGATARELLRTAAANKWNIPVYECRATNGRVEHHQSAQSLGYGELASSASKLKLPINPTLKSPEKFRLLGKSVLRWDTPAKVNGSAVFGTDVDLPGMLYGTVKHCPVSGDKITKVDDVKAKAVPGVISVIPLEDHAVVVANSTSAAMNGAKALILKGAGGHPDFNDDSISQILRDDLSKPGVPAAHLGGPADAMGNASEVLEIEYEVPLQAHAAMEPLSATASVTPDSCEVWAPTQLQDGAMMVAMGVTELPPEKIRIHTTYLGGGFGRKVDIDYLVAPLVASKILGKPVKIIWSREEDTRHDFYRPPFLVRMRFGLNTTGKIEGLMAKIVGPSCTLHFAKALGFFFPAWIDENGYDFVAAVSMFDPFALPNTYAIPNLHVDYVPSIIPINFGFWRSTGAFHNSFALESALDEVAYAGGRDSYEFRRELLIDRPRALLVLDRVAELSNWGKAAAGLFQGISFAHYLETFQAQVVEVSVSKRGKIKVHKITCVVDCGQVFNSHIAKQQLEGGILYGLTATLKGEINIKGGKIVQSNFDDYQMLKLKDTPEINVHLMESREPPGGLGEAGTPLIGPAVANAVFAATGKRVRRLPIRPKDIV